MGELVDFIAFFRSRERLVVPPSGGGEVLPFTGVRYSRHDVAAKIGSNPDIGPETTPHNHSNGTPDARPNSLTSAASISPVGCIRRSFSKRDMASLTELE